MKKLIILITVILLIPTHPLQATETLESEYSATVRDISDREYEKAVIELLDNASESIVVSMYIFKPDKRPVEMLVEDLIEALDRGVAVSVYLNTKFASGKEGDVVRDEVFRRLEDAGGLIYLYNPNIRVHDKVIIVDSRYVVEGSANWSVSALKTNNESATLIDSPGLAADKLRRIKGTLLKGEVAKKPEEEPLRLIGVLPEGGKLKLSKKLFEEKDHFPQMVKVKADRAMDMYILFLIESQNLGKTEFVISPEDIAFTLNLPEDWTNEAKRRQIIKVLRRLKDKYKLIDFEFDHGDDVYIVLKDMPGDTFTVDGTVVAQEFLVDTTASGQFVIYMDELLESEGQDPQEFTHEELTERFHVKQWGLKSGRDEIAASLRSSQ